MPSRRTFLAGLAAAGTAATAGCLDSETGLFSAGTDANSDWPMPRFNAGNDAFAPDAVAPREGVAERWSALDGFDVFAPAVVDGTVYVADTYGGLGGGAFSVGTKRWSYQLPDHGIQGLSVGDGALFVACEPGEDGSALYCLEEA